MKKFETPEITVMNLTFEAVTDETERVSGVGGGGEFD